MEDVISHTIRPINSARYKLERGTQWNGPTTNKVTFLPKAKEMSQVVNWTSRSLVLCMKNFISNSLISDTY